MHTIIFPDLIYCSSLNWNPVSTLKIFFNFLRKCCNKKWKENNSYAKCQNFEIKICKHFSGMIVQSEPKLTSFTASSIIICMGTCSGGAIFWPWGIFSGIFRALYSTWPYLHIFQFFHGSHKIVGGHNNIPWDTVKLLFLWLTLPFILFKI